MKQRTHYLPVRDAHVGEPWEVREQYRVRQTVLLHRNSENRKAVQSDLKCTKVAVRKRHLEGSSRLLLLVNRGSGHCTH